MEADLAPLVVEFLLRRSPDDLVANAVLQFLPLSDDDSRLKKVLLLRKIESEMSKGSVSENILPLFELIEELDYENGAAASDSIKTAYCAVAVDCAFRCLDEPEDGDKKFYFAVKRIRGRVWEMERSEKGGLVSDELRFWRKEMEESVWDSGVCENVRLKSRKIDALGAVKSYLVEAWGSLGPSLLDLEFGRGVHDETLKEVLKLCNDLVRDQVGDSGVCLDSSCPDPIVDNGSKDKDRHVVLPRRRYPRRSRGVKISSQDESEVGTSSNNSLPTTGLNNVQRAPPKNSLSPQAAPTSVLSDVLQLAEDVMAGAKTICVNGAGSIEGESGVDHHPPNLCLGKSTEVNPANEANCSSDNDVPKPSSASQNINASNHEQDDLETRPHLRTSKQRLVSLEKKSVTKYARKRDIKRWSLQEEDTLRTGVKLYGVGSWKAILNAYREAFEERTEVDLKDKWRNMTRR